MKKHTAKKSAAPDPAHPSAETPNTGIVGVRVHKIHKTDEEKAGPGRPPLPIEMRRTGRLAIRTYPDVEAKAKRVGYPAVEEAIRNIKE